MKPPSNLNELFAHLYRHPRVKLTYPDGSTEVKSAVAIKYNFIVWDDKSLTQFVCRRSPHDINTEFDAAGWTMWINSARFRYDYLPDAEEEAPAAG